MTEPLPPEEAPFPGARSQVPGYHNPEQAEERAPNLPPLTNDDAAGRPGRALPLEATVSASGQTRLFRFPVRAEHVTVSKAVVVREQVRIRQIRRQQLERVSGTVKREVMEEPRTIERGRP